MRLFALSGAWVAGVFVGSQLGLEGALLLALALSPVLLLSCWPPKPALIWGGLCLLAFLLGGWRFQNSPPSLNDGALRLYNGSGLLEVVGVVENDPEPGDGSIQIRLTAENIRRDAEWLPVMGKVLVFARDGYPGYGYGDWLKVKGQLETPPQLEDFDYYQYLARQGIHSVMRYPQIERLATGHGFAPLEWIYRLRRGLADSLAKALPEPQASLAQGILLGLRRGIPDDVSAAFARTGTTHILAISGQNISIVAGMASFVGVWVFGRRRGRYLLLSLAIVWGYAVIAGAAPSVLRAAIMATLVLWASYLGRQASGLSSLAFAAAVMIGLDPLILWDISFQLSFLAMAGIILVAPTFQERIDDLASQHYAIGGNIGKGVVAGLASSLGAVLATLPVIALNFHRISSVSLLATLLALPALPAIIVTGAFTAFAGLLAPPFAQPIAQVVGWAAWPFVSYLLGVVTLFAQLPFASWETKGMNEAMVWAYYGLALALLWLGRGGVARLHPGLRRAAAEIKGAAAHGVIALLALVAVAVWTVALTEPDHRLHVYFLDVGQGDAIFIETPSGRQVLIDGGPSPQTIAMALGKRMPFWDRSIDLVVLTHPQEDHLAGLVEVMRRYQVAMVLEGGLGKGPASYGEWQALLKEQGIPRLEATAGQRIDLGAGVALEVLHPHAGPEWSGSSDVNNASAVLRLTAGYASFLFTGDVGVAAEKELLTRGGELKSTVIKVAHHGSDTATSPQFIEAVDPQMAVISVGADNRFGHPAPQTLERLVGRPVYRTDQRGTIEVVSDGQKAWTETER